MNAHDKTTQLPVASIVCHTLQAVSKIDLSQRPLCLMMDIERLRRDPDWTTSFRVIFVIYCE